MKGELLAVTDGTLWIRDDSGVREMPMASLASVRVQRHSFSGGKAFRFALVAGLASGAAMVGACSSVEGASCGRVGLVWMGLWLGAGALAAPSVEASRWLRTSPEAEALRPYARFPQGPPEGVDLLTLGPPPPATR